MVPFNNYVTLLGGRGVPIFDEGQYQIGDERRGEGHHIIFSNKASKKLHISFKRGEGTELCLHITFENDGKLFIYFRNLLYHIFILNYFNLNIILKMVEVFH